jgi:hypothetical protein
MSSTTVSSTSLLSTPTSLCSLKTRAQMQTNFCHPIYYVVPNTCVLSTLLLVNDIHFPRLRRSAAAHPEHWVCPQQEALYQPKHARRCVLELLVVERGSPIPLWMLSKGTIGEKLGKVVLRCRKGLGAGLGWVGRWYGQKRSLRLASQDEWPFGFCYRIWDTGGCSDYGLACRISFVRSFPYATLLIISLLISS